MLGNPIYRKLMSEVGVDWQACDALVLSVSQRKLQKPELRWEGACMLFGSNGHGGSVILSRPSVTDLIIYLFVTVALALSGSVTTGFTAARKWCWFSISACGETNISATRAVKKPFAMSWPYRS